MSVIENQHSQWWRTALLLPPLHLRGGHGKHPPCLQWLSGHHSADAPAAVRAVVMDNSRTCSTFLTASTALPASLALPYRQRPQSSRRQENDHLTQFLFSTCPIKNIFKKKKKNKLSRNSFIKYHPGLADALGYTFVLQTKLIHQRYQTFNI